MLLVQHQHFLFHYNLLNCLFPFPVRAERRKTMEVPCYLSKLLFELNEQRKRDFFCDCSILVEGRVFKAHRNVLFAGSGYFRALLVHYLQVRMPVLLCLFYSRDQKVFGFQILCLIWGVNQMKDGKK